MGGSDENGDGNNKKNGDELDFYALLNVAPYASRDDIKAAYTRLARVLHPDKLKNVTVKKEAAELFILIDRAYKVLSDDTTRLVYDQFGHDGLAAMQSLHAERRKDLARKLNQSWLSSWRDEDLRLPSNQVGFYDERGRALRNRILGRIGLDRELESISRFNVRGAVQVSLDGRGLLGKLFEPPSEYDLMYDDEYGEESISTWLSDFRFESPSVHGVVVQQSVEAPLSKKDTLTLDAQTFTRKGSGSHSVSVNHEHEFDESTSSEVSLSTSTRDPLAFSLKGNRILNAFTRGSLEFVVRDGWQTGLNVQGARKLSETLTGVLQLGLGTESGLMVQLNRSARFGELEYSSKQEQEEYFYRNYYQEAESGGGGGASPQEFANTEYEDERTAARASKTFVSNMSFVLFLAQGGFGLQTHWVRSLGDKVQGKLALKLTTGSIETEATASKQLSAVSKGNVSVTAGLGGVRLTLRYDRGGIRYVVPIALSSGFSLGAAFIGGLVPTSLNYLVSTLLRPYRERREARLRYDIANKLVEARKKALVQMEIMAPAAQTRRKSAETKGGLFVLRARYGYQLHEECDWRQVDAVKWEDFQLLTSRPRLPSDWDEPENTVSESNEEQVITETEEGEPSSPPSPPIHPPNIDVTTQLNFMLSEDTLEMHGGATKANLLGFYNPCLGLCNVEPKLFIRYQIGHHVYEITTDDLEPVQLPSHRAVLIGNTQDQSAARFEER